MYSRDEIEVDGKIVKRHELPSLDDLGVKYGTGKSSIFHDFLIHYEEVLRGRAINTVLEIGAGYPNVLTTIYGASLRMWSDFFPRAKIYCLEKEPACLINDGNIRSFLCDQSNLEQIRQILFEHRINPDLVIEDGSHIWSHQIISYNAIYPILKSGAIYIVEDLHTSVYWKEQWKDQEQCPLDFFSALKDFSIIKTNINAANLRIRGIVGIGVKP